MTNVLTQITPMFANLNPANDSLLRQIVQGGNRNLQILAYFLTRHYCLTIILWFHCELLQFASVLPNRET